nr:MAG TPA: hypothetical protein [Bacteriophage sp.]
MASRFLAVRLTKRMIALQLSWGDNCKKVL